MNKGMSPTYLFFPMLSVNPWQIFLFFFFCFSSSLSSLLTDKLFLLFLTVLLPIRHHVYIAKLLVYERKLNLFSLIQNMYLEYRISYLDFFTIFINYLFDFETARRLMKH